MASEVIIKYLIPYAVLLLPRVLDSNCGGIRLPAYSGSNLIHCDSKITGNSSIIKPVRAWEYGSPWQDFKRIGQAFLSAAAVCLFSGSLLMRFLGVSCLLCHCPTPLFR
ncbi:hypothetical protein EIKCOROL_01672 [Eikenella corrodens ATCC 23834]|uniref:Uncharacterized protein n=1 Tax=Eikenella corrodens ATCC 23834 TaxID=546274 RepID=C0DWC0_EIKCO|nr:hypothetical protein EIKCOROL_01672 [Eikenella corrodens ATCC 23834]